MTPNRRRPDSALRGLFPEDDTQRILGALLDACDGLAKTSEMEREDGVTVRLWQRLKRLAPFRDGPFFVNHHPAVLDSASMDAAAPDGVLDLQVTAWFGPDAYFAIEAKRLRFHDASGRFRTGTGEYIRQGMMRFISGQYAPRMRHGAMLGYVYDGDVPAAETGLANGVNDCRAELRLLDGTTLQTSAVLPSGVHETQHRLSERTFLLFHIAVGV